MVNIQIVRGSGKWFLYTEKCSPVKKISIVNSYLQKLRMLRLWLLVLYICSMLDKKLLWSQGFLWRIPKVFWRYANIMKNTSYIWKRERMLDYCFCKEIRYNIMLVETKCFCYWRFVASHFRHRRHYRRYLLKLSEFSDSIQTVISTNNICWWPILKLELGAFKL